MLGLTTYQPHIWAVPKDDIYQAEHAMRMAKEYIVTFITQIETGTVRPLVGIAKQIRDKAAADLKTLEDAIQRLKSPYKETVPECDPSDVSALPPFGVKQDCGLRDDFLSKRQAKRAARIPNPDQQFWTCRICLRSKFTRPGQPHKCVGGRRKRFSKYARMKGWDSCWIETPKPTSCRSLHLSGYWEDGGYNAYMNTPVSALFHNASG